MSKGRGEIDRGVFARLSTKECMIPPDSYFVPQYIKDVELAIRVRAGDVAGVAETVATSVPVHYTHDGGFFFQKDASKKREPPKDSLTPLSGYVRAVLLCANPPRNKGHGPELQMLERILDAVPRPNVKSGRDEEYIVQMMFDRPRPGVSTGCACISDLTLLSLLRRIPWVDEQDKKTFMDKHADRYAVLDSLEPPKRRMLYIDDMIRTHDYSGLVRFLQQDRSPMLKKFYGEDVSTAFPYYTYGWFRCFVVLMQDSLLKRYFEKPARTFDAESIAIDAGVIGSLPEYCNDRLKYPCMPFSPGTRGHYFVQWLFAADLMLLVDDTRQPEEFVEIIRNRDKRSDMTTLDGFFSSWIRF